MNLQELELTHLVTLLEAAGGNALLRSQIESELHNRIQNNTNYSREYFFDISKIKNHAITVSFIPTSKSFGMYGPSLTIDIVLTDEEMQEMTKNYSSNPPINTAGIIKAKILVKDNLSDEQIANASDVGFHTNEVFEILHF
jgi:hypothetical protein